MLSPIEKFKNFKFVTVFAVAFCMFVDAMGYGVIVPLIPVYSDKILNLSDNLISFFVTTYAIGLFVFVPFVNLISKKIGNKHSLILGGILLIFSSLIFPIANSFEVLLLARFLQGASAAITWTCGLSLVAQSVQPQHRSSALATAMVGVSVGHLIGAPFAGFLYGLGGIYLPFIGVISFSLFSLSLILSNKRNNELFIEKEKYENFDFIKIVLSNKILIGLSIIVLLESFMLSYLEPSLSLIASRKLQANSEMIGLLFGTQVLLLAIFSPIAAKIAEKYGKIKIIPFGIFFSGIIFIMMSYTEYLSIYFILMGLLGIACAFSISPVLSAFADEIDKTEMKGLYHIAYGFLNFIYSLGMIIGPSFGFLLNDIFSDQTSYLLIGFILIFTAPLFTLIVTLKANTLPPFATTHSHLSKDQKDKPQDYSTIS